MQNQHVVAMEPPFDYNPTSRLWEKLGSNMIFSHHVFEWFKLAKLCMVMVFASIFLNLTFIKSKICNWLNTHLDMCFICMFNIFTRCIISLLWLGMKTNHVMG
jgi:hypothetical protein